MRGNGHARGRWRQVRHWEVGLIGNSGLALRSPILTTGVINWAAGVSGRRRCCDSPQVDGHATAYVCIDSVCRAPIAEPEALRVNLQIRIRSIVWH
jgi:hypothetical protein